jgi:hypothetical protein
MGCCRTFSLSHSPSYVVTPALPHSHFVLCGQTASSHPQFVWCGQTVSHQPYFFRCGQIVSPHSPSVWCRQTVSSHSHLAYCGQINSAFTLKNSLNSFMIFVFFTLNCMLDDVGVWVWKLPPSLASTHLKHTPIPHPMVSSSSINVWTLDPIFLHVSC